MDLHAAHIDYSTGFGPNYSWMRLCFTSRLLKYAASSLSCYKEDATERKQKHVKTVIRQVRSPSSKWPSKSHAHKGKKPPRSVFHKMGKVRPVCKGFNTNTKNQWSLTLIVDKERVRLRIQRCHQLAASQIEVWIFLESWKNGRLIFKQRRDFNQM